MAQTELNVNIFYVQNITARRVCRPKRRISKKKSHHPESGTGLERRTLRGKPFSPNSISLPSLVHTKMQHKSETKQNQS